MQGLQGLREEAKTLYEQLGSEDSEEAEFMRHQIDTANEWGLNHLISEFRNTASTPTLPLTELRGIAKGLLSQVAELASWESAGLRDITSQIETADAERLIEIIETFDTHVHVLSHHVAEGSTLKKLSAPEPTPKPKPVLSTLKPEPESKPILDLESQKELQKQLKKRSTELQEHIDELDTELSTRPSLAEYTNLQREVGDLRRQVNSPEFKQLSHLAKIGREGIETLRAEAREIYKQTLLCEGIPHIRVGTHPKFLERCALIDATSCVETLKRSIDSDNSIIRSQRRVGTSRELDKYLRSGGVVSRFSRANDL